LKFHLDAFRYFAASADFCRQQTSAMSSLGALPPAILQGAGAPQLSVGCERHQSAARRRANRLTAARRATAVGSTATGHSWCSNCGWQSSRQSCGSVLGRCAACSAAAAALGSTDAWGQHRTPQVQRTLCCVLEVEAATAAVKTWASMTLLRCCVAHDRNGSPIPEPCTHCRCAAQLLAATATLPSEICCSSHRVTVRVSRHSSRLPKESHTARSRCSSRNPLQPAMDRTAVPSVKPKSSRNWRRHCSSGVSAGSMCPTAAAPSRRPPPLQQPATAPKVGKEQRWLCCSSTVRPARAVMRPLSATQSRMGSPVLARRCRMGRMPSALQP
jgi:hypothetical protein